MGRYSPSKRNQNPLLVIEVFLLSYIDRRGEEHTAVMYFRLNEAIFVLDVIPFEPGEEGGECIFSRSSILWIVCI